MIFAVAAFLAIGIRATIGLTSRIGAAVVRHQMAGAGVRRSRCHVMGKGAERSQKHRNKKEKSSQLFAQEKGRQRFSVATASCSSKTIYVARPSGIRLRAAYFWLIADKRQGLLPTGRVKVQNSSNFTGSVLLPTTTAPVASSVV
jgi:hypothetical protein